MQFYCESLTEYKRLKTREVKIGDLLLGSFHPIRVQTMTTTDTMDTLATVEQSIRCIEAGSEIIRITAPSKREAENLLNIKNELRSRGYATPIVADIHFTPNAAEIAARIVEKVRVNPGNYVDKKKFETIEYTDAQYQEEIDRIRERFTPLIRICKEYGTAMRIGTNHGSLSDRIMSRYGDTPMGMVESAMEFLRIARDENYHQIVLSMKSSNPQVMVHAYRLLVKTMFGEFTECYPLHLGVTEAGDGEDGRIKSAVGVGTLLEDGLGDTIRVSLTEEPEVEIPVCRDIVRRYNSRSKLQIQRAVTEIQNQKYEISDITNEESCDGREIPYAAKISYSPFEYKRRDTFAVNNIGEHHVPVVIADLSKLKTVTPGDLKDAGYQYDQATDKWAIADMAADYIFTGHTILDFALPGTLKVIVYPATWLEVEQKLNEKTEGKYFPIFDDVGYTNAEFKSSILNFVMVDCFSDDPSIIDFASIQTLANDPKVVLCLSSQHTSAVAAIRRMFIELMNTGIKNPVIITVDSNWQRGEEHLIHYAIEAGALLLEGMGDGICLGLTSEAYKQQGNEVIAGRNYLNNQTPEQFINNTAFSLLQATRTRISKTEYISCPSCGRTLFDLQETTAKIRAVTNHLKGVKIAIMGCIVNGPGEMADADFGYVGSGPGKITLYKGKEIIKRNVNSEIAVEELINLLKANEAWIEP
jgi:(E)-4-hydroxy-3-methylbut-2-enyl-diphosphate synthase